MSFSIIACVGQKGELGKNNDLVFKIKEDMDFFKKTTTGHPVLMGKNTFKSIGHALPGRENFVVSYDTEGLSKDVTPVLDLDDFIKKNRSTNQEIFVIGGASIYKTLLPFSDTLYLTEVDSTTPADVFFPDFNHDLYDKIILKRGSENGLNYVFAKYTKK